MTMQIQTLSEQVAELIQICKGLEERIDDLIRRVEKEEEAREEPVGYGCCPNIDCTSYGSSGRVGPNRETNNDRQFYCYECCNKF